MRIKRCVRFVILMLGVFFCERKAAAQVIPVDSMALVALYNKTPALQADTTWLNGNVSGWSGVSVIGNRVLGLQLDSKVIHDSIPREICDLTALDFLSLNYCQFVGVVPSCIIEMPALRYLGISNNLLTGVEAGTDFSQMSSISYLGISSNLFTEMPDFLSISSPDFQNLDVRYNYFNFDDLLPMLNKTSITNYTYYSQADISPYQSVNVNLGGTADFPDASIFAGGTGNTYNWRVLDLGDSTYTPPSDRFSNINGPVLHVNGAQLIDSKLYDCEMTNPNLPGLVLKTGPISMLVIDPLLPQSITYLGDTIAYCGDSALVLSAITTSGNPVSFISTNSSIATVNADNTLSLHRTGTVSLQATTPADATYHADTLWIDITVASHVSPLPFLLMSIIESPSTGGDELKLDIRYFSEFTYQWTLPNGQTYDGTALTVSPFTASDTGRYEVRVTEGTCLHSSPVYTVSTFPYGTLSIYELITPNGDGDNETFYIENLDPAIRNEVSVFNAVHQIVYHQENYRNDWDGSNLPVGTYYYLLKYGEQTYKGNLYIKR